jgi:predicted anti-sigma-YlaC factor YlaD
MTMRCEEINEMLPAYAGEGDQSLAVRRHLSRCPGCRAERERYASLAASLSSLSTQSLEPPAQLSRSLVAIPQRSKVPLRNVRTHLTRNRRTYGGVAAVALVGAGTAVWRTRSRRLSPA